jgi:hypothetical protein
MFQFICHKITKPFNKVFFLLLLTNTNGVFKAISQANEEGVKRTINTFFSAMKNADTITLKNCFADHMQLHTIVPDKIGNNTVMAQKPQDFLQAIGVLTAGAADEKFDYETIKIDGPLAVVWTPYQFYFNGNFSHCGVNSFQLIWVSNSWKIQSIIDTRRKKGCF